MTDTVKTPKIDTTYNGWPNRQTWNVMLWMDNDEPCYRAYREVVERYKAKGKRFTSAAAQRVCMDCLGETTPDGIKVGGTKVRWTKIAEAMREE